MPRETATSKLWRAVDSESLGRRKPGKLSSHVHSSYSICNLLMDLPSGVQDVSLCIHDDFTTSDSSIVIHLGRDTVKFGKLPPEDGARQTYDIGPLSITGEDLSDEDEEEQRENGKQESQTDSGEKKEHILKERDQDDACAGVVRSRHHRRRGHYTYFFLTPAAGPDPGQRRRSLGFWSTLLVIVLSIAVFVPPKSRPRPTPDHTRIKPLAPSPDESFAHLMQRHAATPRAIVESGATDKRVYSDLLWDADEYCGELRLKLASDWAHTSHAPLRRQADSPYHGPAYANAKALCDKLNTVLSPLAPEVVVPLHGFMVSYWGVHAVSGLLSAADSLAKVLSTDRDSLPLLDGADFPATSSFGDETLDGSRAMNASLAIAVLQELSKWLTLPREWSKPAIADLGTLNTSLDQVVVLGTALLEPRWERWLAQNRPSGDAAQGKAETPSQKDLQRLASLRDRALARLSVLKSVQGKFSGPATEALVASGSDMEQLKGRIDSLVAGHGWTHLVQHEEQWVLDWYYLSLRPDLPNWLKRQAHNITIQLEELSNEQQVTDDKEERVRRTTFSTNANGEESTAGLGKWIKGVLGAR